MKIDSMIATATGIAFAASLATVTTAEAREHPTHDGPKGAQGGHPQVKCYREVFAGKDKCKGNDRYGHIVQLSATEAAHAGPYFTTDAQTCHQAGLSTHPPHK